MKLHFMKYRKLSYWISAICVALSILSIVFRGFNYGSEDGFIYKSENNETKNAYLCISKVVVIY